MTKLKYQHFATPNALWMYVKFINGYHHTKQEMEDNDILLGGTQHYCNIFLLPISLNQMILIKPKSTNLLKTQSTDEHAK